MGAARVMESGLNPVTVSEGDQTKKASMREIRMFLKKVVRSVRNWNQYAGETMCPVVMVLPKETKRDLEKRKKSDYDELYFKWGKITEDAREGLVQGVLYDNQIRTCIDVINTCLRTDRHLALLGAPQLGKTATFLMLFFVLPIVERFSTGLPTAGIINLPSYTNIFNQSLGEAEAMARVYGDVKLKWRGDGGTRVTTMNGFYTRDNPAVFDRNDSKWYKRFIGQRNPSVLLKWLEHADELQGNVRNLVLFMDEAHFGSGAGQIQDKWEKGDADQNLLGPAKFKKLRRICISATLSEQMCEEMKYEWVIVAMWVADGYSGPISYMGHKLKLMAGYTIREPKIQVIEDFLEDHEIDVDLDYDTFHEAVRRPKRDEADVPEERQSQEEAKFSAEFTTVFRALATDENPIVFVRPSRGDTKVAQALSRGVKAELARLDLQGEYKVVDYHGQLEAMFRKGSRQGGFRTLKQVLLEEYVAKGLKVLVISDSRSIMGDSYPKECKYFIDFTRDPHTWNTEIQSTYGRACGHGKASVCLFREGYAEGLINFLSNGAIDTSKPMCFRTVYGRTGRRGRPTDANLEVRLVDADGMSPIQYGQDDPLMAKMLARLTKWVNGGGDQEQKWTEGLSGRPQNVRFRSEVLPDSVLDGISARERVGIAHWGEPDTAVEPKEGKARKIVSSGDDKIGIRVVTGYEDWRGHARRGTTKNNRMDDPKGDKIYPQVVVTAKPGCRCPKCGADTREVFLAARMAFTGQALTAEQKRLKDLRKTYFPGVENGRYMKDQMFRSLRRCCWDAVQLVPVALMLRQRPESHVTFPPLTTAPAMRLRTKSRYYGEAKAQEESQNGGQS